MLIDSHCHLNSPALLAGLPAMLQRAAEAGVSKMQTICTTIAEFEAIKAIANAHDQVFASVGVHPGHVSDGEIVQIETLLELADDKKVVGLGETGLDYFRTPSDDQQVLSGQQAPDDQQPSGARERQKQSFINHIAASRISGLPVIIHCRDAEADVADILAGEMKRGRFKAVMHCFTGTKAMADLALELGLYISISGIVTFKNAQDLQAVVRTLPLDRLLIETDAPYLAPVPFRGKCNEPAFVRNTAEGLALLLGLPFKAVAGATTENFLRLFNRAS